jgi:hypothetical protein
VLGQAGSLAEDATQFRGTGSEMSRPPGVVVVLASAAGSDPEIADIYNDQRRLARSLTRKGALRPGLSEAHATDITWAVANPTMHHRLVAERRWTGDEYERWLAHTLACSLLETQSLP